MKREKEYGNGERELEEGGERGEMAPRHGSDRSREMVASHRGRPKTIGDQGESESQGKQIKKGVVSGEGNQELQGKKTECGDEACGGGSQDGEREKQFDQQGKQSGEAKSQGRELLKKPSGKVGDRLGLKVVGESGEIGPSGVGAQNFDRA